MFWLIYTLAFLIGLVQTPILVDILRVCFPEWRLKRLTGQASRVLFITLITVFFLSGLGFQVFVFVPLFPRLDHSSGMYPLLKLACHCLFAYWIWINMAVNFYYAAFVCPGVDLKAVTGDERKGNIIKDVSDRNRECSQEQTLRFADENVTIGEPMSQDVVSDKSRALINANGTSHYCKTCKRSVLNMDHHCPFTGNCVGLRNYSYFFLWIVYSTVGLGYEIIVILVYFGQCAFPNLWLQLGLNAEVNIKQEALEEEFERADTSVCNELEEYLELVFPVIGGFIVLTVILLFHVFLLLADMTTYDILKNVWKAPVFKIGWQRIKCARYKEKDSRLKTLLLRQRSHPLCFLIPVKNTTQNVRINPNL